jgi:hypothetical protein
MFLQELATAATWHQGIACNINTYKGHKAATTGCNQGRDQSAFSAESEAVTRIFHIAPCDDATIIDKGSNTDRKL